MSITFYFLINLKKPLYRVDKLLMTLQYPPVYTQIKFIETYQQIDI